MCECLYGYMHLLIYEIITEGLVTEHFYEYVNLGFLFFEDANLVDCFGDR